MGRGLTDGGGLETLAVRSKTEIVMSLELLVGIGVVSLAILLFLPKRWRWDERPKRRAAEPFRQSGVSPVTAQPDQFGRRASQLAHGVRGSGSTPADDREMDAVRKLEAYATHQGGFDYYFAHIGDQSTGDWAAAICGLRRLGLDDAVQLVEQAQREFLSFPHDEATQDEVRGYMGRMKELDRRWRALGHDLDTLSVRHLDG